MSIGISGQYEVVFSISSFNDFINEENLDRFTLIEEVDCKLPTFELTFKTKDVKLLATLNEGNILKVSMRDPNKTILDTTLVIMYSQLDRSGLESYLVKIQGMYDALNFLYKQQCRIFKQLTAVEALNSVTSPYFKFDTNCKPTADAMNWVQHGNSDRSFATNIWLHSERPKSFPLVGISSEGIFRYRDAVQTLNDGPVTDFGYSDCAFLLEERHQVSIDSGFLNSWVSYGIDQHQTDLITGENPRKKTNPNDPIFSTADSLNRKSDTKHRFHYPMQYAPDNVHTTYWECYRHNLSSLAANSVTVVTFNISHTHLPIKVCDLVLFKDDTLGKPSAVEDYSGLYVVTKISRIFGNRDIYNVVEIRRDSLNTQKGSLR